MVTGCCAFIETKGVRSLVGPGIEACVGWRKKAHRRPLAALLGVLLGWRADERSPPHNTRPVADETKGNRQRQPCSRSIDPTVTGSNEEIS